MELRSRVLAEVETGDSDPGVPGPSSPLTEGSGEPVLVSAMSHRSITEEAGASLSHPSTFCGVNWGYPEGPDRWPLPDVRNNGRCSKPGRACRH